MTVIFKCANISHKNPLKEVSIFMKKHILIPALLLCLACVGCSSSTREGIIQGERANQFPAPVEFSHEELVQNAQQMVRNIHDSYDKMIKEAAAETATKAGKLSVEKLSGSIEKQIEKLDNINWDAMSDEEIRKYADTLSDMITQIREIRDKIAGI